MITQSTHQISWPPIAGILPKKELERLTILGGPPTGADEKTNSGFMTMKCVRLMLAQMAVTSPKAGPGPRPLSQTPINRDSFVNSLGKKESINTDYVIAEQGSQTRRGVLFL